MTPPPPSAPPGPTAVLRAQLRAAAGWILRVLLWGIAVVAAASIGGPLAVLGFSGIALVVALGLLALGATTWRRAGLPLSLCAAAVALTAAVVAAQPVRIDRSHGLLIAKPKTPKDVEPAYRRGVGNVVVDLRDFRAPVGSTTTINARSDTGRVVVALPRGRCFNVEVDLAAGRGGDAVLFEAPLALARSVAGYSTGVATLHGQVGAWEAYPVYEGRPESPTRLIAYGRTVFAPGFRGDQQSAYWRRPSTGVQTATLVIKADVATDLIVRDYPQNVGAGFSVNDPDTDGTLLSDGSYSYGFADPTQVADLSWPDMVQVPASPGDRRWRDRFQAEAASAERVERQRRQWSAWFARARAAAQRRSVLGAGTCAARSTLSAYWSRFSFSRFGERDATFGESYTVTVNGIGQARLYRDSAAGPDPDYIDLRPDDNPFTNPAILKEFAS